MGKNGQAVAEEVSGSRVRPRGNGVALAEDAARVEVLRAQGFAGPSWTAFIDELTAGARRRVHGLVYSGKINEVAVGHPHPTLGGGHLELLRASEDHRDTLVVDAIMWARDAFREHLVRGRWRPSGGNSLMSYFIGTTADGFWIAYKRWAKERHDEWAHERRIGAAPEFGPALDHELLMAHREALRTIMRSADLLQHAICLGILQGYDRGEIAEELQIGVRAVEVQMRKLRAHARHLARRGVVDETLVPGRRRSRERAA